MIVNQLMKFKEQSRLVIAEAKKASELFDKAFGLAIYNEFKHGDVVTYEELNSVEIGQSLPLPTLKDGEITYKRFEDEEKDMLKFHAWFTPDSVLPRHKHDCVEIIFVVQGNFEVVIGREEEPDFKIFELRQGEILSIPATKPHQFMNNSKVEAKIKIKYLKP